MRSNRTSSPLRNWDAYWQKKWDEEKKSKENSKKVLTNPRTYGIIRP